MLNDPPKVVHCSTEKARKNLKLRKNSKEYLNLRIRLAGNVANIDLAYELLAYALESEKGGSSNALSREIYRLIKEEGL